MHPYLLQPMQMRPDERPTKTRSTIHRRGVEVQTHQSQRLVFDSKCVVFNTPYCTCIFGYMPRAPRRPQPAAARRFPSTGPRGITSTDVDRAADALLRDGQRPTIEKVRATIGRGSPNTINPLLDAWWQRLAGRLDAGPAALHRLPEPVLHAAEGLWLQTLSEARKRAATEQGSIPHPHSPATARNWRCARTCCRSAKAN